MSGNLQFDGHLMVKQRKQQPITRNTIEEEPLWVPWWMPQASTHFTFFRAFMAGLFSCFIFATSAYLAGYTPSKLGQKYFNQAIALWKKAPPSPEIKTSSLPAVPKTANVDNLDDQLWSRACGAEAIAKKQVAAFFDAKDAAKRKKRQPVPREDLMSSDDEDEEDPDPPLHPGAEAPFTLLFGAECAEGAKSQDREPFAFLLAHENLRPAVETIRAPMEASDLKTTISTKKFQHSLLKKSKLESQNKGLSSSSSS